jgi:hypothetical protein
MADWRMSALPPPAPRLAGGADRGRRGVVRGCPLLTADLGWFAAPARPGWASGSVWSRTPPALRSSATRDRSAGRARQGRYKLGHEHILIRHICGMRSRWQHTTRPAQRSDGSDRGCPLDTGVVRLMWHANGTTGEERLGAGGELEALRPPARSPLFAGASNRHHLPTGGAPGAALPPGSLRGTRPGPGRHSRFYAAKSRNKKAPYLPEPGYRRDLGCSCSGGKGYLVPTMADPEPSSTELRSRAEQARAHSQTLQGQVAELAEAVAQVELDVARVHEDIADQGGSLAARAREHAKRAREFAASEHAEAVRLRRDGRAEDRWPEGAA